MLINGNESSRSLMSNITFDDESFVSESDVSENSGMPTNKWSSGAELDANESRRGSLTESFNSSQPIPMPERKGSTHELFHLPVKDLRAQALKQAMMGMGCPPTKSPKIGGSNLLDKFLSTKRPSTKQPTSGSRGRMANAKWDLTGSGEFSASSGNERWESTSSSEFHQSPSAGPSLASLLSSFGSSSSGSSNGGARKERRASGLSLKTSFSRISMDGMLECSTPLKKPQRKRSKDGLSSSDLSAPGLSPSSTSTSRSSLIDTVKTLKKKASFSSSQRRGSTHSTMPLTMPVRKTSTHDLLNAASSGGSSSALRRNLSRSKLSFGHNPMVPRRIGSASSMVRNQSREHLRRQN